MTDLDPNCSAPTTERIRRNLRLFPSTTDLASRRIRWSSGRFQYTDRSGQYHIFHDIPLRRRMSWDGVSSLSFVFPPPHRARKQLEHHLSQRAANIEAERLRTSWWLSKKESLQRQLNEARDPPDLGTDRLRRFFEDAEVPSNHHYWLPQGVDNGTIFWREPETLTRHDSLVPKVSKRRYHALRPLDSSFDISPAPRNPAMASAPSVLLRPSARYVHRQRSAGTERDGYVFVAESTETPGASGTPSAAPADDDVMSSDFWQSSRNLSIIQRIHEWCMKILVVAIFKILSFLCCWAPCVAGYRGVRKLRQSRKNHRYEQDLHRTEGVFPTIGKSAVFQCPECDQDYPEERRTREWRAIATDRQHAGESPFLRTPSSKLTFAGLRSFWKQRTWPWKRARSLVHGSGTHEAANQHGRDQPFDMGLQATDLV
jgi:hypothetical protein